MSIKILLLFLSFYFSFTKTTKKDISIKEYYNEITSKGDDFTKKNNKINLVYFTPWNNQGEEMIVKYAKKLDIFSPVWFDLKPELLDKKYNTNIDGSNYINKDLIKKIKDNNSEAQIIPRFNCQGFNQETLSMMVSEQHSDKLIKNIIKRVKFSKFNGVNLDCTQFWFFEDIYPLYVVFQTKLFNELKKLKMKLIITMFPYSESLNSVVSVAKFEYLSRYCDYIVLMTYDYIHYFNREVEPSAAIKNSPETWISKSIEHFTNQGKATGSSYSLKESEIQSKILVGTPFHGFIIDRNEVKQLKGNVLEGKRLLDILEVEKASDNKLIWDEKEKENLIYIESENTSYVAVIPSKRFISNRVDLINSIGVGGLAIWEVGQGYELWLDEI